MKRILISTTITLSLLTCVLILAGCGAGGREEDEPANSEGSGVEMPNMGGMDKGNTFSMPVDPKKVIVEVEGRKLTQRELDFGLRQFCAARRIPPQYLEQIRPKAEAEVVDGFVIQTLLHKEAQTRGLTVPEKEYEDTVGKIKAQLPPGASLEAELQKNGLSLKEWEKGIEGELLVRKFLKALTEDTPEVSDQEVKDFYEETKDRMSAPETVKARHILLKVDPGADEAAKKEKLDSITKIREDLLAGSNFVEMAKAHSDCPSSSKGGDLGEFPRGQMVKEFEDAAFTQKINDIGPIVTTKFGHHIIQVLEHQKGGAKPLEEVQDDIFKHLQEIKKAQKVMTLVEELRPKADIKYAEGYAPPPPPPPPLKTISAPAPAPKPQPAEPKKEPAPADKTVPAAE